MKNINQNTILITGGGSGIGLEMAKRFAALGNRVIITGRNAKKLEAAAKTNANIHFIVCDINNENELNALVEKIRTEYDTLNVLINNAGEAHLQHLGTNENVYANAKAEMQTNYLAAVNLTEKLIPLLKKQNEAAIINISSIVAFAPSVNLPTYSASKAALHSYTQSLRLTLSQDTQIKVFEVMPPLVDTGLTSEINAAKIPASVVVEAVLEGIQKENYEIHVGFTQAFYTMFLNSPEMALKAMNRVPA